MKSAQEIWDRLLIQGWERDKSLAWLVHWFIEESAPVLNKLGDFRRSIDYITSLDLDRCKDPIKGGYEFQCNKHVTVRCFVDTHSRQLTNFLFSEEHDNSDILINISNFKWKKVNHQKRASKKRVEHHKILTKLGARMTIHFRENDKRHDWNTVK